MTCVDADAIVQRALANVRHDDACLARTTACAVVRWQPVVVMPLWIVNARRDLLRAGRHRLAGLLRGRERATIGDGAIHRTSGASAAARKNRREAANGNAQKLP